MKLETFIVTLTLGVLLAGCSAGPMTAPSSDATGSDKGAKFQGPPANAGIEVKQTNDPKAFASLVASNASRFHSRPDPFSLTKPESAFDIQQSSERVFNGNWMPITVQAVSEVAPAIYVEPQPYRRLSGIVVGDSVEAILEPGPGLPSVFIRPGMQVPGTPWTVVSINEDQAVLRRGGDVLPHEVIVRLESPPGGVPTSTTTTTTAPGGFPGGRGGFPGGPGRFGGGRGGPGGRFGGGGRGGGGE